MFYCVSILTIEKNKQKVHSQLLKRINVLFGESLNLLISVCKNELKFLNKSFINTGRGLTTSVVSQKGFNEWTETIFFTKNFLLLLEQNKSFLCYSYVIDRNANKSNVASFDWLKVRNRLSQTFLVLES